MNIINLDQKSPEWLEWRKKGIGASESAILVGMSKYSTPYKLWEEKTGRAFPKTTNYNMQHGIDNEEGARHLFMSQTGRMYTPYCAEHKEYPHIKASFDGVTLDMKSFVEIKCPVSSNLHDVILSNSQEEVKSKFPHYWVQVQHQYLVCDEAESGYLASYKDGEIAYIAIDRDVEFIEEVLKPAILVFYYHVENDIEPPLSDKDFAAIDDDDAIEVAHRYQEILNMEKELKEDKATIRSMLINYGDDGNFTIGNILKLTRVRNIKGRVDTKKLYKDYLITDEILEQYRKISVSSESIGTYRITEI